MELKQVISYINVVIFLLGMTIFGSIILFITAWSAPVHPITNDMINCGILIGTSGIIILILVILKHKLKKKILKFKQQNIKKSIETYKYNLKENEIFTCSICLEDGTQNKNNYTIKLKCGHIYHIECIQNWINVKKECPICRNKLDYLHYQKI